MFKITVGKITKSIALNYCPFCGAEAKMLENYSYVGENEDDPRAMNFQCHGCGLHFSVGDVSSENHEYLHNIVQEPLEKTAVIQDFLQNFTNGIWSKKENFE